MKANILGKREKNKTSLSLSLSRNLYFTNMNNHQEDSTKLLVYLIKIIHSDKNNLLSNCV